MSDTAVTVKSNGGASVCALVVYRFVLVVSSCVLLVSRYVLLLYVGGFIVCVVVVCWWC